jgi:hypothetical protein
MFSNDPKNPLDRIRLKVGDTDVENEYLDDNWYVHFYTSNDRNEVRASIECAKAILARFTGNTREVVDQVEIYGNQQFENYLKWLKSYISDPDLSGIRSPVPFAGGISKSDMIERSNNQDNNITKLPSDIDYDKLSIFAERRK